MKRLLLIITALLFITSTAFPQSKVKTDKAAALVNMVFVAGGTFQMGSNSGGDDEKPVHTVTVSSFYMDKTEVTQAEYRKVMGKNPSRFSGCDDCPVEKVSWDDANAYAQKVGKRLPTEAEWEYAARGGNKSKGYTYSGGNDLDAVGWYEDNSGGNDLDAVGWYRDNSGRKPHPVAQKQPNELGLYDMSGNVWEWCSDWYNKGYYSGSPQTDPQGSNSGSSRVLRGGSWHYYDYRCRVANRYWFNPDYRLNTYGFRLVLSQD
jgi:sulfatase modifying factor 1